MNIERLNEVVEWLEAGAPERVFNMQIFTNVDREEDYENWCGTSCCIGGYVLSRYVFDTPKSFFEELEKDMKIGEEARKILDLDPRVADALFFMRDMKTGNYYSADWTEVTPAQGAKAVRNVIKFKDPKWPKVLGLKEF